MTETSLAYQLKDRLLRKELVSQELLDVLCDEEIIECYCQCPKCREWYVPKDDIQLVVKKAKDADDFIDKVAKYRLKHTELA
jgi:hypothetical protein